MYAPQGGAPMMQGQVEVCIACHETAAQDDYVFARAVVGK